MVKARWVVLVIVALLMTVALLGPVAPGGVARAQGPHPVVIYFFWGDGCPHCAREKPFLEELQQRFPNVEVRAYEVWYVPENRDLFAKMTHAYGFEPSAVPTTFIGKRYWVGFNDAIREEMEGAVLACMATGCPDAGVGIIPGAEAPPAASVASPDPAEAMPSDVITLPLLGAVDLSRQSLWVSTALISFVDGFNPCSLWVLSVLLAITLHSGSRRKVLIIGLVFLTVTSLVYALFIAGLFTVFSVISFLGWVRVLVALIALFFAAVNIKDYFWYKEGISFTISDEAKPGLYRRMRNVLNAGDSLWGLVTATAAMSAGVSLVEFSCTAGFPVLWTNLLTAQGVGVATFVALLLLYMAIYQIDELGIFLAAVITFKASRLEEKHGRILKLIGGTLMLTLAVVMLIDPAVMNRLSTSLLVFAVALAGAGVILFIHRQLLPQWGIVIGTEDLGARRSRRRPRRRRA